MKVRPSVKKICEKCKIIKRKGKVMVPGDKVTVQMSPYDLTRGRITWRSK